jgi:ABC-type multidrug transport system ATPase subunit
VKETIEFATKCTSNGKQTDEEIDSHVDRILANLGLDNVVDTVVGDENLRGISGGQKRRVTAAEMMTDSTAAFMCYENITDGLASTDSIMLIQKLSSACHKAGYAGFVSLVQPSDEMVELFENILVLTSHGELAYFGPVDRTKLREVFLGDDADDPRQDAGSICDLVLKHSNGDSFEAEDAALRRFEESEVAKEMVSELQRLRSMAPSARVRNIQDILPSSEFSTDYWYQFRICANRRVKLIQRNAVTWTRFFIAILFGIIIGSLFSALGNNLLGALGRTGYLFLNCFLVLMLSAAVTIPSAYRERETLFKHRFAEFFSGRVAYVAQVLTDAPLSILEAVIISTTSYFWVDLQVGSGKFFYFMGTLIGLEFVGQALGRLLCAVYRKQVTANAVSSIVILIFGTVGGFMPSYMDITRLLRWLSWLTPGELDLSSLISLGN